MLSEGDPRAAAPDLYRSMNWAERWQIDNAYAARALFLGKEDPRYPDDQESTDVAKRAFVRGVRTWYFVASVPFLMIGAGAYSFLRSGTVNTASVGAPRCYRASLWQW